MARTTNSNSRGFTLVELAVVIAVIGLITAVAAPRLNLMEGAELKSAARVMAGAIRITYNSAKATGKPHRMVFNLEEQSYWVEVKDGRKYAPADSPLLEKRHLPRSVYVRDIQVMDRKCSSSCALELYFTAGGFVEDAAILLSTLDDGRSFTLFTHPMTGRVDIMPGEMSREDWEREAEEAP